LKLGQYLFMKHGGKVVFFGRFVAVLRAWAAFLAGANRMHWPGFLLFNAMGGVAWATIIGLGGYSLGYNIHRLTAPVAMISIALALLIIIVSFIFVRRNEQRLEAEAERAIPGPLDAYQPKASRGYARRQYVPLTISSQEETGPTPSAENKLQAPSGSSKSRAELEKVNVHEAEHLLKV
jgi:hypothetical protein